ncbi:MAG: hypothetical protein LBR32_03915, partial [Propionibacteriaceae bacterium]|nr:hypothetical protein [Propionibacteriaceae bacterium]
MAVAVCVGLVGSSLGGAPSALAVSGVQIRYDAAGVTLCSDNRQAEVEQPDESFFVTAEAVSGAASGSWSSSGEGVLAVSPPESAGMSADADYGFRSGHAVLEGVSQGVAEVRVTVRDESASKPEVSKSCLVSVWERVEDFADGPAVGVASGGMAYSGAFAGAGQRPFSGTPGVQIWGESGDYWWVQF